MPHVCYPPTRDASQGLKPNEGWHVLICDWLTRANLQVGHPRQNVRGGGGSLPPVHLDAAPLLPHQERYTHEGGALKGTIHLTTCTLQSFEVMPVDCPNTGRSVATGWRFAIQIPAKRYILAAMSERDLYGWLHALKGVVVMLNEESRTDPVPSRPPRAALIRRWFRLL
ncbi:hypothetical protein DYB32_009492 [Aphanomyces invadans]|uniref:PH domain-containing protein n=1 Tax=Aphanomyces invadans TaxID=157072 RepID=A0A418AIR1_9STRA|nr:hypothetical protein DYB32_009492 [Aphanomyces invadans]